METLDEQLDAANAKVAELTDRVAGLEASLQEAASKQGVLETANAELTENLKASKVWWPPVFDSWRSFLSRSDKG